MMKYLLILTFVVFAPMASYAADVFAECRALQARVLELDRDIVCAEKKGGNARLDYMLERNFMMQLLEASKCSGRKMPEAVMSARAKVKCDR